ncbi:MAG TPA: Trk system potassium transport protein TrkA, partial [Rhodospirillaceae bacterium]|nr:Trk system potassium transport protein TrkA [Rhodospirillaceae bacterium]
IEHADAFCAVTNDDEVNIMSSLMAKRLGVRQVMSLISKPAYVDLVQGSDIDIAISPEQATISSLLTHVRRADVVRVHSLSRGATEAIEAIVHGDIKNSKVVGKAIKDIALPPGTSIGAVARGDEVYIDHDEIVIETGDHVILFLVDKKQVRAVEKLFEVGISFFN